MTTRATLTIAAMALGLGACQGRGCDEAAGLFSLQQLPRFELTIDDDGLTSLSAEPKQYVKATFRHGTTEIANVGVKLRGRSTLTTLAEKPSLKIKFNKFDKDKRFLGLEALTLNNMRLDPSMVRDYLGYSVFRDLGLVAPRVGYAEVTINGTLYGLYCNVETLDDVFLKRNFRNPSGNLYEANEFIDIDRSGFDQDEGADHSGNDLLALKSASTSLDGLRSQVDPDRLLRYLATEALVGNFDGYNALQNYYLYRDPETQRWTWIPWSMDRAMSRDLDPYEGRGLARNLCFKSQACRSRYTQVARDAAGRISTDELLARLDAVTQFIEPAVQRDPRLRLDANAVRNGQLELRRWLAARPAAFVHALDPN